jgi:hypothetical protein
LYPLNPAGMNIDIFYGLTPSKIIRLPCMCTGSLLYFALNDITKTGGAHNKHARHNENYIGFEANN